jgi:TPR repeat protein
MKGAIELQKQRKYKEALTCLLTNPDGDCCFFLAYLYQNGYWGLPINLQQRDKWLSEGVKMGSHKCELYKQRYHRSLHLLLSCETDDPFCKALVFRSRGLYTQALEYYTEAADAGNPFACKDLLMDIFFRTELVDRKTWMQRGIELGNIESFHFYGMYLHFHGDEHNAIHHLTIAAEQGCGFSQKSLIQIFVDKKDYGRAYNWYKIQRGFHPVLKMFARIEKCQLACYQLMMIRRRRQSVLCCIPRDVVQLIAKILWTTKEEECWEKEVIIQKHKKIKL